MTRGWGDGGRRRRNGEDKEKTEEGSREGNIEEGNAGWMREGAGKEERGSDEGRGEREGWRGRKGRREE